MRRAGFVLFAAFLAAGLANVFGQAASTSRVSSPTADLVLGAPDAVRSGLIYEVQFTVVAHRELQHPALVLEPGWFDGFTINTIDPEPVDWTQHDGRNVLAFGRTPAGTSLEVRLQYQVNPTTIGWRDQDVVLENAGVPVVALDHRTTIYP